MTTDPRALVERLRKGYDDWRFTILADAADAIEALLAERDSFETLWRSTMDVLEAERAERDALRAEMAKEGWRQCAVGQRTTQFCGQLEAAVLAEREACARVCDLMDHDEPRLGAACACAIRRRSER